LEQDDAEPLEAITSIAGNILIGADSVAPANTVAVFVDVACPKCGCILASLEKYVDSADARIGAIIAVSFTGSCFNRKDNPGDGCGSGKFDWKGTITEAKIVRVGT
jgi:hypothetical protein